jgi:HSP20 family protein
MNGGFAMSLLRYDPWSGLRQIHDELQRALAASPTGAAEDGAEPAGQWLPAVDIREDDKAYLIQADLPGVAPEDIDVYMENGYLTIRGSRESERKDASRGFKRVERVSGAFFRRFALPETVAEEGIEARTNHGVLEVRVPKKEAPQPKRIKVATE